MNTTAASMQGTVRIDMESSRTSQFSKQDVGRGGWQREP
jgi:hypothetical protein